MTLNEVAPPGFGHTKGDKKKGIKKGGTAAAFDRARKEGRFKGSKSDMFAIMWSQKNKGDKPHYKPGTDKKYKKYQDESFEIDKSAHKTAQKKAKMRNLARGNENPNEKAAAEKKAGGPKLIGEEECQCDCGQDPCIECGESHHNINEEVQGGVSVETYTKNTKFTEIETVDIIKAKPLLSEGNRTRRHLGSGNKKDMSKGLK